MIRANQTDLKIEKLRENPVEIYVMRFSSETTPGPAYIEALCRGAVMHDTWFEADWYDTAEEVYANIAESARSVYSAEKIVISRDTTTSDDTRITREPEPVKFKCMCGCEFEAGVKSCRVTESTLEGEFRNRYSVTYWKKCPVCGHECASEPRTI